MAVYVGITTNSTSPEMGNKRNTYIIGNNIASSLRLLFVSNFGADSTDAEMHSFAPNEN